MILSMAPGYRSSPQNLSRDPLLAGLALGTFDALWLPCLACGRPTDALMSHQSPALTPKVCKLIAICVVFGGFGLSFYILLGSKHQEQEFATAPP